MNGLIRTRSVLTFLRHNHELERVEFMSVDDGRVEHDRPSVNLSEQQWADLGKPDSLTVAIWPGDRQDLMESEVFPV